MKKFGLIRVWGSAYVEHKIHDLNRQSVDHFTALRETEWTLIYNRDTVKIVENCTENISISEYFNWIKITIYLCTFDQQENLLSNCKIWLCW